MIEKALIFIKKNKVYGLPALAIAAALLIALLVILPQLLGYFSVQKTIGGLESQAATLNNKAVGLSGLDKSAFQSNLNTVSQVLPPEKDLPSAMSQVQSLVSTSGMQLEGMSFTGTNNDSSSSTAGVQNYQIKLDLGGTKSGLAQFTNKVKNGPEIMQITGLEIEVGKEDVVTATVTLTTYYGSNPPAADNSTGQIPQLTQSEQDLLTQLQNEVAVNSFSTGGTLPPRGKLNPFQ